uniref:UPF3A regulator of nonsense mediated mRNA decay n=1 Tax=Amazona collaria TaxID=241587 RepID=A0A8B9G6F2_9PSIT
MSSPWAAVLQDKPSSWAPLCGLQVLPENLLLHGFSQAETPFRACPPALAWGSPQTAGGYLLYRGPSWTSGGPHHGNLRAPGAPPPSLIYFDVCKINLLFLLYMQVVIRRLPPCLTKEQLEEQLHPLPAHDYFEFCTADPSLYPHLYSRAYINFRNPEDILLFRDRFDGYVFIDNKGLEYPAVVEFAPFQKISKKKLKKKDAKAGSIEDDPEYRKFLESYCADEEKICANPEILLGEIEAKTRELIGLFS